MRRIDIVVPLLLPNSLHRLLRGLKDRLVDETCLDLSGDRAVEWSWMASRMPTGPGKALDFGSAGSYLDLIAASRGFDVTALDIQSYRPPYEHERLTYLQGDVLEISLGKEQFDLVLNCSTVEHVGLAGRYGVSEHRANGDLEAMAMLRDSMKPAASMLLTIPVGRDAVHAPWHRVYGYKRLPILLKGYRVDEESFWVKNQDNRWVSCSKETALDFKSQVASRRPFRGIYALGCFLIRKPKSEAT